MNDGRQTLRRCDIRSPTTINNTSRSGQPACGGRGRDPEDSLRAPLSGAAAHEYGREEKEDVQDFADCRGERLPPSKLGVVVPTGFEPVFKDDYDFALYLHELRRFS